MTMPDVVVFDLDDTLYLERNFVTSGYAAIGAHMRAKFGVDDFAERAEAAFARGERGHVIDTVLAELGLPTDRWVVEEAVRIYREHRPTIGLAPDARRYLEARRSNLALLSDGPAVTQGNKVAALGLDCGTIFPIVLTGKWGRDYWKPHPRGFAYLQSYFGLPPACFTYVADNPSKDFVAPCAMGWHTVQIQRPGRVHADARTVVAADVAITTLDDLADCLADRAA